MTVNLGSNTRFNTQYIDKTKPVILRAYIQWVDYGPPGVYLCDPNGVIIKGWMSNTPLDTSMNTSVDEDISQSLVGRDSVLFIIIAAGYIRPATIVPYDSNVGGAPQTPPWYFTLTYNVLPCYQILPKTIDLSTPTTVPILYAAFGSDNVDLSAWDGTSPVFVTVSFARYGDTDYNLLINGVLFSLGFVTNWFVDISPYIVAGKNAIFAGAYPTDISNDYAGDAYPNYTVSEFSLQTFDWAASLIVGALQRAYSKFQSIRLTPPPTS